MLSSTCNIKYVNSVKQKQKKNVENVREAPKESTSVAGCKNRFTVLRFGWSLAELDFRYLFLIFIREKKPILLK